MNILVTGASGFIASKIVADLIQEDHQVTGCVRNTKFLQRLFPKIKAIQCNFIKDTASDVWLERLKNIDVVINCVGILYHPNEKIIWKTHYETPKALFDACVKMGVKKIIQISALGVEHSEVAYAKSKKAADEYLLSLPIKAVILRPSMVYSVGSYGGSSLFRGLAALPFILPVPGNGQQQLQPIHLYDLSRAILQLIEKPIEQSIILNAVGSNIISLKEILIKVRSWLGFAEAKVLMIPLFLIRIGAFLGDRFPYSSLNSSSYKMLNQNNVSNEIKAQQFFQAIDFIPRDFISAIENYPSTVEDRWFARLFFLKPLLLFALAFIWILSGVVPLIFYPKLSSYALLANIGIPTVWRPFMLYSASLMDIGLGLLLLFSPRKRLIASLQILLMMIYSAIITWKLPQLWLEPFMPIAKNLIILVATLFLIAMESEK